MCGFLVRGAITKSQKWHLKPMAQDVYANRRINNIAAIAASAIVNCQLSIVIFSGFAATSVGNLSYSLMSPWAIFFIESLIINNFY
jgi:hypothetical protein